jgi:hypothetical protein
MGSVKRSVFDWLWPTPAEQELMDGKEADWRCRLLSEQGLMGGKLGGKQRTFPCKSLKDEVSMFIAINLSEQTANDCAPQKWKNPSIIDISNERAPWPISTATVGQFPGDFCAKGARFGTHEMPRRIFAPYYGKLLIVAFFNAGVQVFDIRDPYNPRRVGYFIQAPNRNTQQTCGTFQGNTNYCRRATFSDLGELDDRGYIYNMDRAGSGLTILQLTGAALEVVTAHGENDN